MPMQDEKIAQLKKMISNSPVLSSNEKTEWLAMLGVMNDKQLADLEMILSTHRPAPKPMSISGMLKPNPVAPSLKHIANLPKTMVQAPAQESKPPVMKEPPAPTARPAFIPLIPWDQKLHQIVEEKELPAAKEKLEISEHTISGSQKPQAPAKSFAVPTIQPKPQVKAPLPSGSSLVHSQEDFWAQLVKKPATHTQPVQPVEHVLEKIVQPPVQAPTPETFTTLDDVSNMAASTLKKVSWNNLVDMMQQITRQYGFLQTRFAFEKSPLFIRYVLFQKQITN